VVEHNGGTSDSPDVPTIAELLLNYRDRTGASYGDMSKQVNGALSTQRIQQLTTAPPKEFPKRQRTIELFAELLQLPISTIVLAYAAGLGLPVKQAGSLLAISLPPGTDNLTDRDQAAILSVTRQLIEARREADQAGGQVVNLARPPAPDFSRIAARRGSSEGRRLRDEQDEQGDATE
jgi:hypothetical protein